MFAHISWTILFLFFFFSQLHTGARLLARNHSKCLNNNIIKRNKKKKPECECNGNSEIIAFCVCALCPTYNNHQMNSRTYETKNLNASPCTWSVQCSNDHEKFLADFVFSTIKGRFEICSQSKSPLRANDYRSAHSQTDLSTFALDEPDRMFVHCLNLSLHGICFRCAYRSRHCLLPKSTLLDPLVRFVISAVERPVYSFRVCFTTPKSIRLIWPWINKSSFLFHWKT